MIDTTRISKIDGAYQSTQKCRTLLVSPTSITSAVLSEAPSNGSNQLLSKFITVRERLRLCADIGSSPADLMRVCGAAICGEIAAF